MFKKNSLQICRLLIFLLLFNIVVLTGFANASMEDGAALICTSVGLVPMSLSDIDDDGTSVHSVEHCVYCKLYDQPQNLNADHLLYPVPDIVVALNYQSVLASRASQHIIKYERLRAPPFYL